MAAKTFHGIPREDILWSPSVDQETCIGCGECLEVCPNGVFSLSELTGKVTVADPMNCVVLCDKCAHLCPVKAISFPDKDKTQKHLVELFHERSKSKTDVSKSDSQFELL